MRVVCKIRFRHAMGIACIIVSFSHFLMYMFCKPIFLRMVCTDLCIIALSRERCRSDTPAVHCVKWRNWNAAGIV